MSGGSKTTGTTVTNSSMPAQNDVLGWGKSLVTNGKAWAPNTTSMVTPFSTQTMKGLTGLQGQANDVNTRWSLANNFNQVAKAQQGLGANGLTGLQDEQVGRLQGVAGGNGLNAMQQTAYDRLDPMAAGSGYNAQQQSAVDYLNPIARGDTMSGNPFLEDMIAKTSKDIRLQEGLRTSGAGRYGSGAHQGVTQNAIGDMALGARYQNYGDEAARRDNAINSLFGMGSQGAGQKAGAIGSQAQLGGQGQSQKMDAISSLYNAGQQGLQNIQGGTDALSDAYNAKLQPYQTMLGVGNAFENKNQQVLQDQARIFQERKNGMTDPLSYFANLAGAYNGGQQVTTGYQPNNSFQQGLGGGLTAYGATGNPLLGLLGFGGGFL